MFSTRSDCHGERSRATFCFRYQKTKGGSTPIRCHDNVLRLCIRHFRFLALIISIAAMLGALSCSPAASPREQAAPREVVMIIESSPTNLDPRVGTDAQSERIDKLLFDALLRRDEHFNLQPSLAERWEIPNPRTYVFHLRRGVRFHDGRPLTSADVKWTFDSILSGKIRTAKASTYRDVESIESARRRDGHLPSARTLLFPALEPLGWRHRHRAARLRRRLQPRSHRQRPIPPGRAWSRTAR